MTNDALTVKPFFATISAVKAIFRESMAKKNTVVVYLRSSAGTGYFLVKKKNPKKLQKKLSFRKYDPVLRKHVLFEEKKS